MRSMRWSSIVWVPFFAEDGVSRRGFERTTKSLAQGAPGTRGLARVAGAVRAQQEAGRRRNWATGA